LTAPCVARPEEDTNPFDVGTEPDDDEVAVLDEADADVRDVDVVREVEPAVKPVVGADLAVGPLDDRDWDVVAVEDPEPAV
jgi:hypothetical protein